MVIIMQLIFQNILLSDISGEENVLLVFFKVRNTAERERGKRINVTKVPTVANWQPLSVDALRSLVVTVNMADAHIVHPLWMPSYGLNKLCIKLCVP